MAAWLAYLKSCLLLPKDPEQDPSPEELALRLQLRLQRLDAMREAGARLMARDRLGRDVFLRGAPEGLRLVRKAAWQVRDLRPDRRLRRGPRADRSRRCTSSHARAGDDARGGDRAGRADARHARSTGPRSKASCRDRRTRSSAGRRSPPASSPRSSSPGAARLDIAPGRGRSRRSTLKARHDGRAGCARSRRCCSPPPSR